MTDEKIKALAREYGVMYIDTSAKDNYNVNEAFMQLATAIKNVADDEATGDGVAMAAELAVDEAAAYGAQHELSTCKWR